MKTNKDDKLNKKLQGSIIDRTKLAKDEENWETLCKDPSYVVRQRVAKYASIEFLEELMKDADYRVRKAVAGRLNPSINKELINDESREVRGACYKDISTFALNRFKEENPHDRDYLKNQLSLIYTPFAIV